MIDIHPENAGACSQPKVNGFLNIVEKEDDALKVEAPEKDQSVI